MNDQHKNKTLLIVDDTPANIDVLRGIFQDSYHIKVALQGQKALEIAQRKSPDLILLDIMMPNMDGYQVCEALKADPATRDIPVIFISAKDGDEDESKGFDLGAVDYIAKPIKPVLVKKRVETHIALSDQRQHLKNLVEEKTEDIKETQLAIIHRLGRAAEFKDNETGLHVIRMAKYARLLANAYGMNSDQVELLYQAAPMHDIGKIGIPDEVLLKPGSLDGPEWEIMKRHSEFGAQIIGDHASPLLRVAKQVALYHHEKWDGSGYPHGLSGEKIPLVARIAAIADVFDALTCERSYKNAWSMEAAFKYIGDNAGQHFDPALAALFSLHEGGDR